MIKGWCAFEQGPVEVICYEKVKQNQTQEIMKLATFLNVTEEFNFRQQNCLEGELEGNFKRAEKDFSTMELYTEEEKKILKSVISEGAEFLKRSGKEDCTQYFEYL